MEVTEKEVNRITRMHNRVQEHLTKHGRSLQEEAALVEMKKSHLSKAERDYVTIAAYAESLQSKEVDVQVADDKPELVKLAKEDNND